MKHAWPAVTEIIVSQTTLGQMTQIEEGKRSYIQA